jgi:hypothetical protein
VVVGSPASVVKALSPAQLEQIKMGLSIYQDLTRRYLKSFSLTASESQYDTARKIIKERISAK